MTSNVLPIRTFLVILPTSTSTWLNTLTRKGNGTTVSAGIPVKVMDLLEPANRLNIYGIHVMIEA